MSGDERGSAQDRLEAALRAWLEGAGAIDSSDLVTHFVIVTATSCMETGYSGVTVSSGPSDNGLPPWQARGLLEEAKRFVDAADALEFDSDEQDD